MKGIAHAFTAILAALVLGKPALAADPVADFYKGKNVFLQIGAGVGSVYDITGRIVAKYMQKYIPGNPTIVVQIIPGGASLPLANQFGNTTPRDGTYFGLFNNGMPTTPLFDPVAAKFDPRKFNFLGSPNRQAQLIGVWHTAKAQTIPDFFTTETVVAATAPGAATYDFPKLADAVLGAKFKIIPGYNGLEDTKLALQRGEADATFVNYSAAKTDYAAVLKSGEFKFAAAFGMKQHPALTNIPLFPLGRNAEENQLFELIYARQDYGLPFLTPPDVPPERIKALRTAFESTLKDPDFLAEAKKLDIDLAPVSADELTALTKQVFDTPPDLVARMQKMLAPEKK